MDGLIPMNIPKEEVFLHIITWNVCIYVCTQCIKLHYRIYTYVRTYMSTFDTCTIYVHMHIYVHTGLHHENAVGWVNSMFKKGLILHSIKIVIVMYYDQ